MAGLETIALAVAHLESLRGEEEGGGAHVVTAAVPPIEAHVVVGTATASMPYPRLHGRMVSDDSIHQQEEAPAVVMEESSGQQQQQQQQHAVSMMPVYSVHPASYYQQWYAAAGGSFPMSSQPPTAKEVKDAEADAKFSNAGPVAVLLHKVSLVTDDLEDFFALMNAMEQLALPDNAKPAEIPGLDENIVQVQVQRHDVLLGRGGETNHHLGNIQYRQLVKASQPAYLAAKRRDKPRIAAAIVAVVRARSGRFLKKHLGDHTWRDVGNVRAREKTSQALREGAPELRGNVEAYRTQLLTEAVESSGGADSGVPAASGRTEEEGGALSTTTHDGPVSTMAPTFVPGVVHHFSRHHYPVHFSVNGAPPPGSMYYHHHHPPVVYHHPAAAMDGLYHPAYPPPAAEKRGLAESAAEPPSKRPATDVRGVGRDAGVEGTTTEDGSYTNMVGQSSSSCDGAESNQVSATVSAENSEEEVPVRTLSPASSTCSSKVASRGPRIKLLKQRIEDACCAP